MSQPSRSTVCSRVLAHAGVRIELEADRFLAQIGFGQHGPGSLVQAFHRRLRHLGKKRLRVPGRSHHTGNARPNRRCQRSLRKNALTAAKPSQAGRLKSRQAPVQPGSQPQHKQGDAGERHQNRGAHKVARHKWQDGAIGLGNRRVPGQRIDDEQIHAHRRRDQPDLHHD